MNTHFIESHSADDGYDKSPSRHNYNDVIYDEGEEDEDNYEDDDEDEEEGEERVEGEGEKHEIEAFSLNLADRIEKTSGGLC